MSWESITIGDLGKVITGNTPPKKNPEFYGDAYKFIKPTDMTVGQRFTPNTEECYSEEAFKKYEKSLIPPLSTCVVTIGSIGQKMTMTEEDSFVNQAVNAIIPSEKFDPFFVFYAIKNILPKVKNADTGASSGRENVSKSNFMSLSLEVPTSKDEQSKIARILSAYDDLIENNLKRIKLLEEAAQNIYKEWFVNYRFPNHENTPINEETGLPEGWCSKEVKSVIKIIKGKKPKKEFSQPVENSVLYLLIDVLERKEKRYAENENLRITELGETLMLMDGSRSGKVFRSLNGAIGSTLAVFRIIDSEFGQNYCYHFFKFKENEIISKNTGSAIPHANKSYIYGMSIPLPSKTVIADFENKVQTIMDQLDILNTQNEKLKEARDILLPRLMNQTIKA